MYSVYKKMSNMDRTDWIIAISNSAIDGVEIYRFRGTDDEVKEKLLKLLNQDKKNDEDAFEFGTDGVDNIDTTSTEYNAFSTYSDYRIEYTAKRWYDVDFV